MKTAAKTDIVNYVLGLFATAVLLVAWPRGKKGCKGVKWSCYELFSDRKNGQIGVARFLAI